MPKDQDAGYDKLLLYDTEYALKVKHSTQQSVQDNPSTDNDILFDISKCNIRWLSMQYIEKDIKVNIKLKI